MGRLCHMRPSPWPPPERIERPVDRRPWQRREHGAACRRAGRRSTVGRRRAARASRRSVAAGSSSATIRRLSASATYQNGRNARSTAGSAFSTAKLSAFGSASPTWSTGAAPPMRKPTCCSGSRRVGLWRIRKHVHRHAADIDRLDCCPGIGSTARRREAGRPGRDGAHAIDDFGRRDEDRPRAVREMRGDRLRAEMILVPVGDEDRVDVARTARARLRAAPARSAELVAYGGMPSRIGASIRNRRPAAVTSIPELAT